jgi:hypothetical protein
LRLHTIAIKAQSLHQARQAVVKPMPENRLSASPLGPGR